MQTLIALASSGVLFVIVGLFGTMVASVGKAAQLPRVESFGRAVEAAATNLPALYLHLRDALKGKKL